MNEQAVMVSLFVTVTIYENFHHVVGTQANSQHLPSFATLQVPPAETKINI
jgi:hypothetical protein